jgi:hypothetical protein
MELELKGILTNYQDPEVKEMLEAMNSGVDYDELKRTMKESANENLRAWTEEEDRELMGLWEDFKNSRDKFNHIADVTERSVPDVRRRLITLGLLSRNEAADTDELYGGMEEDDDNSSVEGGMSTPSAQSSASSEPDENNDERMREVIMGKKKSIDPLIDQLTKIFTGGLKLTEDERLLLGTDVCEKYSL